MAQPIHIRSWQSFQSALADTLIGLEAWHYMVVRVREAPQRSVRFAMQDDRLLGETSSEHSLSSADQAALRAVGWVQTPRGTLTAEASWPAPSAEYRRLSGMAVALLHGAFRLETPQALETDEGSEPAREREGTVARPPGAGADLGPRRLEQTTEYLLASRPGEAEQHEELFARSLQSNDLGLRQVAAGDRMAVLAAEDFARVEGGAVVPVDGCIAQPGMRHVVAVVRDPEQRPLRLLVTEAVGPDCELGSMLVDEGSREWAPRGTGPYLRWMLEHDGHLRQLFAGDRALAGGLRDGTVQLDYRLIRVSAQGKVTMSRGQLEGLDPAKLRLGQGEA